MSVLQNDVALASRAIDQIMAGADVLTAAIVAEQRAITTRDEHFLALVNSLIGQPNPMTGKPHSQTSAEAAAKEDGGYKTLCTLRTDAECARLRASAALDVAKLSARLAVAAVEQ